MAGAAASLIASMRILLVTLITAPLVILTLTAWLLMDSFHRMIVISTLTGAPPGLICMYLSYYVDVDSGAPIVLQATSCGVALTLTDMQKHFVSFHFA